MLSIDLNILQHNDTYISEMMDYGQTNEQKALSQEELMENEISLEKSSPNMLAQEIEISSNINLSGVFSNFSKESDDFLKIDCDQKNHQDIVENTSRVSSEDKMVNDDTPQEQKKIIEADSQMSNESNVLQENGKIKLIHKKTKVPRTQKPKGYETKNMLKAFKQSHIKFLQKILGFDYVNSLPFIVYLKKKSGISLEDYQNLYKQMEFKQIWKIYFKNRVAYRDLMNGRCNQVSKQIFQQKIIVFERAFMNQQFKKIKQ